MKINEATNVQMPLKTVISLIVLVAAFTMGYFQLTERLNRLETSNQLMEADLLKKAEQTPKNLEMYMLIEHNAKVIEKHQSELDNNNIPIKLHYGAEVFFLPNLLDIKDDPLATFLHGKYMLIEFQFHQIPDIQKQQLFDLKMAGVTPIIAHPERYKPVQENSDFITDWLEAGCLIQVDAGSLLGTLGRSSKIISEKIISSKVDLNASIKVVGKSRIKPTVSTKRKCKS